MKSQSEQSDIDGVADLPVTFRHFSTVLDGVKEFLSSTAFIDRIEQRLGKRKEDSNARAEIELVGLITGLERRIAQLEMEKAGRASR